jgi:hypothetical protein
MQLRSKHGPHTLLDCLVELVQRLVESLVEFWEAQWEQVLEHRLVGLQENQWFNY